MKIIADSGSTKTLFLLIEHNREHFVTTDGINPFYQNIEDIEKTITNQLLPQIEKKESVESIEFYGAGCTTEKSAIVKDALLNIFPDANIFVGSDLLGAAKALCGNNPGIACIIGTGSNSALYDGEKIVANVSPLGYILGDEASGAYLGKLLVADIFKNQAPASIIEKFYKKYNISSAEIIDRVYRKPFPNRFLASFAPFISENLDDEYCKALVTSSFKNFIRRNIKQYPTKNIPINFVGSIAYYFKDILKEVIEDEGLIMGIIKKSPLQPN